MAGDGGSRARASIVSVVCGAALVAAAIVVPHFLDDDVRVHWPPLHADWMPRFSTMTVVAIIVGVALWYLTLRFARTVSWTALLLATFAGTWIWTVALAYTDGSEGLSRVFDRPGEYVYDAQRVDSIPAMLREFVDRIPMDAVDNWHTHVAGHPPGALIFFVILDRLGITSSLDIAFVVVTIGSTAVVAALVTLRVLGSESVARSAAPWLILAPTAVWMGVNGDAVFTAVSAWGLALLAIAAKRHSPAVGVAAGLLLGLCVYLSYGLVLLGILSLAVLWIARSWKPLPWALLGAGVVVAAFTLAGFRWWEAYPVLVDRYNDGIASERAYGYWVWANVAAWSFTVGVATWAAFPQAFAAMRRREPLAVLAGAAMVTILLATLSGMSKAEVERIWLPFTLWIVTIGALLPERWKKPLLLSQVAVAVIVQQLVLTRW
ncbi:MAG: hypothetical protein JWP10_102 [Nocardioidaceae bacterium]|nr:hypothetical protein [Nocardioidaceae bacterium]